MRRRIQIKIWPELTGYLPAIIPFDRMDKAKSNPIDIDFSNLSTIESSSLNLILIKLIKISTFIKDRDWDIKFSNYANINKIILEIGFLELLKSVMPTNKLFLSTEYLQKKDFADATIKSDENIKSYPIYEIDFSKESDRRVSIEKFKDYLVSELQELYPKYKIKVNKLIQVLHEIAKNSADHTDQNAYFGMDICISKEKVVLKFSFGDLGEGINQNIRRVLENNPSYKDKVKHLAITDSYNFALSMGFTSKPYSLMNRGIGMSTIFDLSKQINLKLSVFDAESRGLLSEAKNISHVELRRVFYNIGFSVGFYYYGELTHFI